MVRIEPRGWSSLFFAIPCVVACGLLTASVAKAENYADKMFKEKSHDFRIVGRGTTTQYQFDFTNPYNEDVHIAGVRTSCGCTTPTISTDTVKTHETGSVIATFNTNSFIGQKAATITVVFDRPKYAEVQLKVSGFIRTDISFDPPEVAFGEVGAGELLEREVVITHTGNTNWEILDVRSHCDNLRVRLNPAEKVGNQIRYRMQVRMNESMPEGDIRERLTLISNDRSFPTTEMSISGRVRPTIAISPDSVSLGTLTSTGNGEKKLVVRGDEPFEITDVECADERFKFEVPVGSKKLHMVKLIFTGDGTDVAISQEIRVRTNRPGKTATCVVTGTIAD